jgi:hypothetical protein
MGIKVQKLSEISESYFLFTISNSSDSITMGEYNYFEGHRQLWYQIAHARVQHKGKFDYPVALAIHLGEVLQAYNIESWRSEQTKPGTTEADTIVESFWEFSGSNLENYALIGITLVDDTGNVIQMPEIGYLYIN